MATDSYGQSITIPALTDAPSIATTGASIDTTVGRTILRFSSSSARAATLTAPVEGMVTWLQDVNRLYVYEGSAWVELSRALTTEFSEDTTNATVTSGTYVNSSRTLSDTIVAPQSGLVEVTLGVRCDNSAGSNTLSLFDASGSVTGAIYTATSGVDGPAIQWADTVSAGPMTTTQVISCTPGETVTVTARHRVVGGTGNLRYRNLKLRQL
jgi:hypothetical protein